MEASRGDLARVARSALAMGRFSAGQEAALVEDLLDFADPSASASVRGDVSADAPDTPSPRRSYASGTPPTADRRGAGGTPASLGPAAGSPPRLPGWPAEAEVPGQPGSAMHAGELPGASRAIMNANNTMWGTQDADEDPWADGEYGGAFSRSPLPAGARARAAKREAAAADASPSTVGTASTHSGPRTPGVESTGSSGQSPNSAPSASPAPHSTPWSAVAGREGGGRTRARLEASRARVRRAPSPAPGAGAGGGKFDPRAAEAHALSPAPSAATSVPPAPAARPRTPEEVVRSAQKRGSIAALLSGQNRGRSGAAPGPAAPAPEADLSLAGARTPPPAPGGKIGVAPAPAADAGTPTPLRRLPRGVPAVVPRGQPDLWDGDAALGRAGPQGSDKATHLVMPAIVGDAEDGDTATSRRPRGARPLGLLLGAAGGAARLGARLVVLGAKVAAAGALVAGAAGLASAAAQRRGAAAPKGRAERPAAAPRAAAAAASAPEDPAWDPDFKLQEPEEYVDPAWDPGFRLELFTPAPPVLAGGG